MDAYIGGLLAEEKDLPHARLRAPGGNIAEQKFRDGPQLWQRHDNSTACCN